MFKFCTTGMETATTGVRMDTQQNGARDMLTSPLNSFDSQHPSAAGVGGVVYG